MEISLKCVRKKEGEAFHMKGGRTGTVYVTKEKLEELFGEPNWVYEEGDGDGKVKYIYQFQTPRGIAHVRDYWWNPNDEHSIAASNNKANHWIKSYLRNHGLKTK